MFKFLILLFIAFISACVPHNNSEKEQNIEAYKASMFKDTLIDYNEHVVGTHYTNYLSYLKKPLHVLCEAFKRPPTDTIFLLDEGHDTWRHDFTKADYNHISFIFGKDSVINVWIDFITDRHTFPLDSTYYNHFKHIRHITQKDFDFLLAQECYGISVYQKDTIKYSYSINKPAPMETTISVDTTFNTYIGSKRVVPPELYLAKQIQYTHFIQKPVSFFLKEIENKYTIKKIYVKQSLHRLFTLHCYIENPDFKFLIVCDTRRIPPTMQDIKGDTLINGKDIHAFIQSHKKAFDQSVIYITIETSWEVTMKYHLQKSELGHYCEQSKIGK